MKQKNILSHYNILIKLANLFSFSFLNYFEEGEPRNDMLAGRELVSPL
jgi:hypothetical protein